MKIYTKTGDDGTTGLFGGTRVKKASARVGAYGTIDELNAALGVARASGLEANMDTVLAQVQRDLFTIGAELATAPGKEEKLRMRLIDDEDIAHLETAIDATDPLLEPLKYFVLPGGSLQAAHLHLARTICRRSEREVLAIEEGPARQQLIVYLNRLSDLLFVFARRANQVAGMADVPWMPPSTP